MPLYLFYTMVQKSQKWPKTQIKGGGGPALTRVYKNKSMHRLISSLWGTGTAKISRNVTFAYCTKGCIDVAVLRGRPLTHVRSLSMQNLNPFIALFLSFFEFSLRKLAES